MHRNKNSSGFSAVEIVLVVAVVALLGFIGWRFYTIQRDNAADGTSQSSTAPAQNSTKSNAVPAAPEIKSTQDLDTAEKTLDGTNTDSDSSQLDSETSGF